MLANAFLILCSYYFVKPLRDGWISISDIAGLDKWEVRAYSSFGQSLNHQIAVRWFERIETHTLKSRHSARQCRAKVWISHLASQPR